MKKVITVVTASFLAGASLLTGCQNLPSPSQTVAVPAVSTPAFIRPTSTAPTSVLTKTEVPQLLSLTRSATEAMKENPKARQITVRQQFSVQSVTEQNSPEQSLYHSVFLRLFDDDKSNGRNTVSGRLILPEGVKLVGLIADRDSKIPNTLVGDVNFSPAEAEALNQAASRKFESNQDTYTFVDAHTLDFSMLVTHGADDLRLILDYGPRPAADLVMRVVLDEAATTEPGIVVGRDAQEVWERDIPLTDAQGQIITDAEKTFVTPASNVDLILWREGTASSEAVPDTVLELHPDPAPVPTPVPTPAPTASSSAPPCATGTVSPQVPIAPTFLLNQNFDTVNDPEFANIVANPVSRFGRWIQWGADYYPEVGGVQIHNPGPGLGDRDYYQEYVQERPNLLESGIYQRFSLVDAEGNYTYTPGDKLLAKFDVDPQFTHEHSDSDIGLILTNTCTGEAVAAYGRPVRGPGARRHEIQVELDIPAGMTELAVSLLAYLGENEAGTAQFKSVSVEQIPQNFYTETPLYTDSIESGVSTDFGPNSPAVEAEFGYDFYVLPLAEGSTDFATTAHNPGQTTGEVGGLVKQVELGSYAPGDLVTASMYAATTFSSPESFAQLKLEFYDAENTLLGEAVSTTLTAYHYEHLTIDRMEIPAGATSVKFVPLVSLGAGETSSLLIDDFVLSRVQPTP